MSQNRYRLRFTFWLDMLKPDELVLADKIELLKNERLFAKTVRDGIRLLCDLRAGRVAVLGELFPWVFDAVAAAVEEEKGAQSSAIEAQLQRLEEFMLAQDNVPISASSASQAGGTKAMNVPGLRVPEPDADDEDTIVIKRDTSTNSAHNFLNSLQNLVG